MSENQGGFYASQYDQSGGYGLNHPASSYPNPSVNPINHPNAMDSPFYNSNLSHANTTTTSTAAGNMNLNMGGNSGNANLPYGSKKRSNWSIAFASAPLDDEPPLLEELGINFEHILKKTLSVLNPFSNVSKEVLEDDDLAGPLIFCVLFGIFLLMSGKVHFGYIYGVGVLGCFCTYMLLNLMSNEGINGIRAASILGYCLLPLVLLASISVIFSLLGAVGLILSGLCIFWCTYSASQMFVTVLNMKNQRFLVAYPMALFYSSFALLTIF